MLSVNCYGKKYVNGTTRRSPSLNYKVGHTIGLTRRSHALFDEIESRYL
ncbi:hypothetical protein [Paraburkholderia sp. BL10I2N1]|nr:hypothetical protein [Paraburkholderia sp. BL10I2N1]TDN61558.1 hypothetical protein B0G77_5030 [Paraburkholderia sp. BL10I2N1]